MYIDQTVATNIYWIEGYLHVQIEKHGKVLVFPIKSKHFTD